VTVVGDVHLAPEDEATTERFLAFLERTGEKGGTLVLLGDLFDWWVGHQQEDTPFARRILDPLRALAAKGIRLAFVEGNRDYPFRGGPGLPIEAWPDVVRARWGEKTVVMSHGDLLCSADTAYLAMRSVLRSGPARGLLRLLPFAAAAWLAHGLRQVSERSKGGNRGARLGIDYALAREWLTGYGADALVLGHVHTGVHHHDPTTGGEVVVLKDWHGEGSVIRWTGDRITLERP
jgi:UDP-2,3-diacylglucosamine hydrolase